MADDHNDEVYVNMQGPDDEDDMETDYQTISLRQWILDTANPKIPGTNMLMDLDGAYNNKLYLYIFDYAKRM